MPRLRFVVALALLLAAAAYGVAPAPAAEAARRTAKCKAAKSRTLIQDSLVRLYEVQREEGTAMYGCRRSNGRRTLLAEASDDEYTTSDAYAHVRLKGGKAAWVETATDVSCKADCPPGYDPSRTSIVVHDVIARKVRSVSAEPLDGALVLSERGGVAWAASGSGAGVVDIHASVRGREDRVLDSGAIDPDSLAVEITIASWIRDGVERFARLL